MANVFVEESYLQDVADNIRLKRGDTNSYKPSEMAEAIRGIKIGTDPDSSDATATAEDIRLGKTAYISDGLTVGTAERSLKKFFEAWEKSSGRLNIFETITNGHTVVTDELCSCINYSDTSNVTNMQYMFYKSANLTTVPLFDTSNVTDMQFMFDNCTNLTTVPLFDTSNVTNISRMVSFCTNLTTVPLFDTSNVTNMVGMFWGCTNLTTVPLFNTSNVTDMDCMFEECPNLTAAPLFDTSNVTDMSSMFSGCTNLTTVPSFNTPKVTTMYKMFGSCSKLTTVPLFDTSKVTKMSYMFNGCSNLILIPSFNTSKVTDMAYMFQQCANLTTVPSFNTSNVTNIGNMFWGCTNLTTVPSLDLSKVTDSYRASQAFNKCANLTECWIRNIKVSLQVGSGTTYGHLLTLDSLLHLIGELVNVNKSCTLTVGTANLEKIADVYVKLIDITDEMRAEDPLIDSKLPFEACESTDEGAMTINDYASLKMWQIK